MAQKTVEDFTRIPVVGWHTIDWCEICGAMDKKFIVLWTHAMGDHYVLCRDCMSDVCKLKSITLG